MAEQLTTVDPLKRDYQESLVSKSNPFAARLKSTGVARSGRLTLCEDLYHFWRFLSVRTQRCLVSKRVQLKFIVDDPVTHFRNPVSNCPHKAEAVDRVLLSSVLSSTDYLEVLTAFEPMVRHSPMGGIFTVADVDSVGFFSSVRQMLQGFLCVDDPYLNVVLPKLFNVELVCGQVQSAHAFVPVNRRRRWHGLRDWPTEVKGRLRVFDWERGEALGLTTLKPSLVGNADDGDGGGDDDDDDGGGGGGGDDGDDGNSKGSGSQQKTKQEGSQSKGKGKDKKGKDKKGKGKSNDQAKGKQGGGKKDKDDGKEKEKGGGATGKNKNKSAASGVDGGDDEEACNKSISDLTAYIKTAVDALYLPGAHSFFTQQTTTNFLLHILLNCTAPSSFILSCNLASWFHFAAKLCTEETVPRHWVATLVDTIVLAPHVINTTATPFVGNTLGSGTTNKLSMRPVVAEFRALQLLWLGKVPCVTALPLLSADTLVRVFVRFGNVADLSVEDHRAALTLVLYKGPGAGTNEELAVNIKTEVVNAFGDFSMEGSSNDGDGGGGGGGGGGDEGGDDGDGGGEDGDGDDDDGAAAADKGQKEGKGHDEGKGDHDSAAAKSKGGTGAQGGGKKSEKSEEGNKADKNTKKSKGKGSSTDSNSKSNNADAQGSQQQATASPASGRSSSCSVPDADEIAAVLKQTDDKATATRAGLALGAGTSPVHLFSCLAYSDHIASCLMTKSAYDEFCRDGGYELCLARADDLMVLCRSGLFEDANMHSPYIDTGFLMEDDMFLMDDP